MKERKGKALLKLQASMLALFFFMSSSIHALEFNWFYNDKEVEMISSDLEFLYSLKFSKNTLLHNKVFGEGNQNTYKEFFEERINTIRKSNTMANLYAFNVDGYRDTIAVTNKFFKLPRLLRIAVLIHEARHSEETGNHWHHVNCPIPHLDDNGKPFVSDIDGGALLSGKRQACDSSRLGSYGIVSIMMKNISENCDNCNLEMKEQAHKIYQDIKKRIISPLERKMIENNE